MATVKNLSLIQGNIAAARMELDNAMAAILALFDSPTHDAQAVEAALEAFGKAESRVATATTLTAENVNP